MLVLARWHLRPARPPHDLMCDDLTTRVDALQQLPPSERTLERVPKRERGFVTAELMAIETMAIAGVNGPLAGKRAVPMVRVDLAQEIVLRGAAIEVAIGAVYVLPLSQLTRLVRVLLPCPAPSHFSSKRTRTPSVDKPTAQPPKRSKRAS